MEKVVFVKVDDLNIMGRCKGCDGLVGRVHQEHCYRTQFPFGPTVRPMKVWIPDLMGPYEAEVVVGGRWNGWLIPRFSYQTVGLLVADSKRLHNAGVEVELLEIGEDLLGEYVVSYGPHEEEDHPDNTYEKFYGPPFYIGAYGWCWEQYPGEDEDEDGEDE